MSETVAVIVAVITQISIVVFVVTSMLAMGLSLTIPQIMQPLKNTRLVILALVANFVLVPALAYIILLIIPLEQGLGIGLILLATAAGAPFLPKLAAAAKGDMAFSVALMVLLMVVTIIYLPLVLPFLLQGVEVNPLEIAQSLVLLMLIPLAIGLFIKARYESTAASLYPHMSQTSSTTFMLMLGGLILLNLRSIIDIVGTRAIIVAVIFLLVSFVMGFFLGGKEGSIRSVMGLGTGQRNVSAAVVVAGQNFSSDPDVLVFIIVTALIGLVLLMPIGGELGKRSQPDTGD
jgi:BASS family bile acid:Na+ symporter